METTNNNNYRNTLGLDNRNKEHTLARSALGGPNLRNPLHLASTLTKTLNLRYPGTNFGGTVWNGGMLALESITYPFKPYLVHSWYRVRSRSR